MEPFFVTFSKTDYEPDEFFRHEGEEFVFLIRGKVEYEIGENAVILTQGDSMYFDGNLPHRSKCLKKGESQAIVILHTPLV
jgi:quercetin dioxygenase-like cupin family protein